MQSTKVYLFASLPISAQSLALRRVPSTCLLYDSVSAFGLTANNVGVSVISNQVIFLPHLETRSISNQF